MKNYVIVSHKFLTQPDDDFVDFLNGKNTENVLHICHSFTDAPDRKSFYKWYKKGSLYEAQITRDFKHLPEPLLYAKELYFTVKWIAQSRQPWNYFIGMDGLCVLFGFICGLFADINKTIFWAIDFVPKDRFKGRLRNWVYHTINTAGYRHADEMWNLGSRMTEAREKFLGVHPSDYNLNKVVPYGVWLKKIKPVQYSDCEKNTLVFMGHLLEKQGVQLVLKAIPQIIKLKPQFKFKIIGGGGYKAELERLAAELNIQKYCTFLGKIEKIDNLHSEVATSAAAIAPYVKKLDRWTYYTDPGKVKTCLACGVPLLLTDIPWNAAEIAQQNCGMIISEDTADIAEKVVFILNESMNIKYRNNALEYAKNFDYEKIFTELNAAL